MAAGIILEGPTLKRNSPFLTAQAKNDKIHPVPQGTRCCQYNGRRFSPELQGELLAPLFQKGGLAMTTMEVLTFCLVIIGIINLFIQLMKK